MQEAQEDKASNTGQGQGRENLHIFLATIYDSFNFTNQLQILIDINSWVSNVMLSCFKFKNLSHNGQKWWFIMSRLSCSYCIISPYAYVDIGGGLSRNPPPWRKNSLPPPGRKIGNFPPPWKKFPPPWKILGGNLSKFPKISWNFQ